MNKIKSFFNKIPRRFLIVCYTLLAISYTLSVSAADAPAVLSDSDADIYAQIFQLQSDEKIAAAAELQKNLEDPLLMPEVLFQRYTSKTYKSKGAEIADWMRNYSDQPGADRIEKIGKIKKVETVKARLPVLANAPDEDSAKSESWTAKDYGGTAGKKISQLRNALKQGNTKNARNILESAEFQKLVSKSDWGRLAGRLAFVYYADGEFEMAESFGKKSADLHSEYGLWTMGLLSFKQEKYVESQNYFADLTDLDHINNARKIEAAFWAGRASEMAGDEKIAKQFWQIGAASPQLFYGALSAAMLGQTPKYEFFDKDYSDEDVYELTETDYGKRAIAFLQIGDKIRAEKYLRMLVTSKASDKLLRAVYSVAASNELPRVSMQVSGIIKSRGFMEIDDNVIFSAQYPLPDWEPIGGWSIDRALLFAITRQESGFRTTAESGKGAKGVMQMMPATAKMVASKNNVSMKDLDVCNPEHNMFLGQQYIVDLLALPTIDNNVIKMLAAYNSGDGAVVKFEKNFETSDPLLYIESFPNVETRAYIKRVVSNLWLYRAKLGQPLTSLEDLANGKWPLYSSEDEFVQNNIDNKTI